MLVVNEIDLDIKSTIKKTLLIITIRLIDSYLYQKRKQFLNIKLLTLHIIY